MRKLVLSHNGNNGRVTYLHEVDINNKLLRQQSITEQERRCKYNVTKRSIRATIVARGKATSITYCECVFIQCVQLKSGPLTKP